MSRIGPDLAFRSWPLLVETLADPGRPTDQLVCFISMFGRGSGVPEEIERLHTYILELEVA